MIPFHKQTDPNKMAGQVVFHDHKQETTLAQYIERKTESPARITFVEWLNNNPHILQEMPSSRQAFTLEDMEDCWNAAIKHGKIS